MQVTLTAAAGAFSVANTYYTVDGGAQQTYSAPFTVSGDGTHAVTFWSSDNAGNTETANSQTVMIDGTAPTLAFGAVSPAPNASGWNNGTVTIPFTAADATSGVGSTNPAASPLTFSTEGANQTQTVTVTDNAGNSATFTSPAVNIDLTAPVTTATPSGPNNGSATYTGPVTVTLAATDNLSGVAATYYTVDGGAQQTYSAPFTVSGDGTHAVTFWSSDNVGNTETANSQTVMIDGTAPTLAFGAVSPAPNASGWNNGTVTIPFTAADATSGVGSTNPAASPLTFSTEGANQTQTVTVTDNAGNSATFTSPAVNIDLTAPVTTASVSGGTITLSATDNLSGVVSTFFTVDGGSQQTYTAPFSVTGVGSHTVTYWSVDKAGNTEAAHALSFTINAAPSLTSISPSSAVAGTSGFTLTVTGSNFIPSSVINWNGSPLATTYVSVTQLTAAVPASLIASAGSANVTVTSPAPGGGTSGSKTFTIAAPALSSVSVSPTSVVYGMPVTGTVKLTGPALSGGVSVALTSRNTSAATIPASVTVAAGQTSATFAVTTKSVLASTSVTITAAYLKGSKTATLTVKPAAVPLQINSGGSAVSPFISDTDVSGGSSSSTTHLITTTGVTNPAPVGVYRTQRSGNFTYTLPNLSPGANYTLRLHFAELTYKAAGKRLFGVSVNGVIVLSNFDTYAAAGGQYKAVVKQLAVTANASGQVIISFVNGAAGVPAVNGIEIY